MIDDNFCYAMVYSKICSDHHQSGLKFFTLDCLIQNNALSSLDIDGTVSGPNSFVDFSEEN